jgi:hypothetical protein
MNPFESTLVSALHDEASEIAMSADLNEGREILDHRLDDVDRGRRRWQIVAGVVAAAAAIAAVAFVAVGRPAAAPQPTDPTSSPTSSPSRTGSAAFESSQFAFPLTVRTPQWVTESMDAPTSENLRHVTWNRCENDICIGLTFLSLSKLDPFSLVPRDDTAMPGYRSYLDYLDSLVADGKATITERGSRQVGGRPATVLTVTPLTEVPDGVGCEAGDGTSDDCWDFFEGVATRMAVVDVGSANPLVILTRTPPDNVNGPTWVAQFDPMLDTVRLDLTNVNPMLGVWTQSFTRDQTASLLADLGLGSSTDRVLQELEPAGDPMTWELWVDPTWYRLYAVKPDGTRIKFDEHTYERTGDRVTGTTVDGSSLVTVSTVTPDGKALRWIVETVDKNPDAGAVSEEAMTRVLYQSTVWVRSTT